MKYITSLTGYDLDKVANSRPYSSGPLRRGRNSGMERGRRQPWLECNQLKGRSRSTRRFPVHRLADWLADWLAGWLVGWLAGLVGRYASPSGRRMETARTEPLPFPMQTPFYFGNCNNEQCVSFLPSIPLIGRSIEARVNYRNLSEIDFHSPVTFHNVL